MTGGGFGRCASGDRFFRRGARGGRAGFGRGQAWGAPNDPAFQAETKPEMSDRLARLESMLQEIGQRLARLESRGE